MARVWTGGRGRGGSAKRPVAGAVKPFWSRWGLRSGQLASTNGPLSLVRNWCRVERMGVGTVRYQQSSLPATGLDDIGPLVHHPGMEVRVPCLSRIPVEERGRWKRSRAAGSSGRERVRVEFVALGIEQFPCECRPKLVALVEAQDGRARPGKPGAVW